jgi:histidinol dehydrogenase
MVYPVYSRRSGGLSIGINLFPDRKVCSFNCPYCEVFPLETGIVFDLETMKTALRREILAALKRRLSIRDICFSGNGEPTLSPHFMDALRAARIARDELAWDKSGGGARLVLITNGTGLRNPEVFAFLRAEALADRGLHIWLKIDAATGSWYKAMGRTDFPQGELLSRIRAFAASGAPFTIQTMLCKLADPAAGPEGLPPPEESAAWVRLVTELADTARRADITPGKMGRGVQGVQIYGKARPAPEDPLAEAAPAAALDERARLLRASLEGAGIAVPVEVYP